MLTEVAHLMGDKVDRRVQCRVRIHNRDRVLGAVQDLEFGSIVNAAQILRRSLGTVGLGGNGQFVRLSALAKLGPTPWSPCLVEDMELGLRLHIAGVGITFASQAAVTQQGLVDLRRLVRQRTRWAQGNLQCVRYVPRLVASRRITNSALVEMLYYLLAPWFNAAGSVAIAAIYGFGVWGLLPGHDPMPYAPELGRTGRGDPDLGGCRAPAGRGLGHRPPAHAARRAHVADAAGRARLPRVPPPRPGRDGARHRAAGEPPPDLGQDRTPRRGARATVHRTPGGPAPRRPGPQPTAPPTGPSAPEGPGAPTRPPPNRRRPART
jgi:hypothetical protein